MKMLSSMKHNNWNVSANEAHEQKCHLELAVKESHNIFQSDCINVLIWRKTSEIQRTKSMDL